MNDCSLYEVAKAYKEMGELNLSLANEGIMFEPFIYKQGSNTIELDSSKAKKKAQ